MNDINALALQATLMLTPLIPYLFKGGIEAGKSAAGKIGDLAIEQGWDKAWNLWEKLAKHYEVKKAAETLAKLPDDTDAIAALRLQIMLALKVDESLVVALEKLLAESGEKNNAVAQGIRSVSIGGNTNNSVIITGNNNNVKK